MDAVLDSLIAVLSLRVILLILLGTLIGVVVGALPGINAPTGIALAIPVTFTFTPAEGLILLGTIYTASIYGGSISAILMNVPGEPADVVTCFDGYPMAKAGEPQRALELATIACAFGSLAGFLALLFLSPPLSLIALLFGPAEIFWVAIFGMTVIGAISRGSIFNGLLGGAFGMLLATVGLNPVTGVSRFTFGIPYLVSGIDIVSALIGLFAFSEMLNSFQDALKPRIEAIRMTARRGAFLSHLKEYFRYPFAIAVSSVIGVMIGIIPAAGPSIGALISYGEVKRHSKNRARFGKGAPEGLISADTGKNAVVGGSIIPLLTLGVPGSPAAAILLGGLIIHGLFPGQELFTTHARVTYTFMIAMIGASFSVLVIGVAGSRLWGKLTRVPIQYLTPVVIALCVIGSFATRNNPADVIVMAGVGVAMFAASKVGFEPAPVVIGLVLGDLAENGFLLGRMLGEASGSVWTYFFLRPIPLIMVGLTLVSLVFTALSQARHRGGSEAEEVAEPSTSSAGKAGFIVRKYHMNMAVGILAVLLAFWLERQLAGLEPETVVFPIVVLWIVKLVGAVMVVQEILWGRKVNRGQALARFPLTLGPLVATTIGYIAAAILLNYYVSTFVYLLLVALILEKNRARRFLTRILPLAAVLTVVLYSVFYWLLDVRIRNLLL
ncbi:MAG: tripartite tricarboxylate transporter permease [Deltaproteobacteria bacterium]